jgi:Pyruvate/2-oxoacid:ferredoxin oxidoreductase gamma subunit/predicted N-acetyltransferase YhbS
MCVEDIPRVQALFFQCLDELLPAGGEMPPSRERLYEPYSAARMESWVGQPERLCLVAEDEPGVVGYLAGMSVDGRAHLHWVAVSPTCRRKGVGTALVRRALHDFVQRHCFLCDAFTAVGESYAAFYRRFGFEQTAVLEKTLLGSPSVYLTMPLRPASDDEMTQHVIIVGDAGQGVQLLGHVLARIFADLGKEVSLNVTKPSSVRGGTIAAELAYSERPIRTPFFVNAGLLVQLSSGPPPHSVRARRMIVDETLLESGLPRQVRMRGASPDPAEVYQFVRHARERFGSPLFVNMIVLGAILGHLGWNLEKLALVDELPGKFLEENLRAIQFGHSYEQPHVYWAPGPGPVEPHPPAAPLDEPLA